VCGGGDELQPRTACSAACCPLRGRACGRGPLACVRDLLETWGAAAHARVHHHTNRQNTHTNHRRLVVTCTFLVLGATEDCATTVSNCNRQRLGPARWRASLLAHVTLVVDLVWTMNETRTHARVVPTRAAVAQLQSHHTSCAPDDPRAWLPLRKQLVPPQVQKRSYSQRTCCVPVALCCGICKALRYRHGRGPVSS
jgi:hypothetical protein